MSATINRKALSAFIQQCLDPLPDAVLVDTHHNQLMRKARAKNWQKARAVTDLVKAGWRWTNIRGNTTYPVNKRILITTTDPRTSNSAAMFLSIVSYVANHNTVVQSQADEKKVLPLVAPLFVNQGYTDNSSEGPFDDYLALGGHMEHIFPLEQALARGAWQEDGAPLARQWVVIDEANPWPLGHPPMLG